MVGWQLSRGDAALTEEDIERIAGFGNPIAEFAIRCNSTAAEAFFKQTGQRGIALPDPVAMGIALSGGLCNSCSEHYVEIEVGSDLTRGMTVVDRLDVASDARNERTWSNAMEHQQKVRVCWRLDVPTWKALLFSALA